MSVLRRAYIEVTPDVENFDKTLTEKMRRQDPGGKAGKQIGGQLNRALKRFDLDAIDIKADPKSALAGIAAAESKLRELSGKAATVEVKIQTERALKQLGSFKRQLGDVGGDAAPEISLSLSQKLGPLLAKLPIAGPMGAGLAAAAASAAPLLGAAVAGGIIGGVGIGGVVGGLALASKDPRVKAATEGLGDRVGDRLQLAATSFVQPAIDGLHEIERAADSIDFEKIFADSSRFVQPLAVGAGSAITDIGHALTELNEVADPVITAISGGIAQIGKAAANGLSKLKDNADGGADALKVVFGVISNGVTATLGLVNILTELYEINKAFGGDAGLRLYLKATGTDLDSTGFSARRTAVGIEGLGEAMNAAGFSAETLKARQDELKTAQDGLNASQASLNRTLDALGGKNSFAAQASDALRTAMDNLYGATIRNVEANESYEASWDSLSDSVKSNGRSLNIHTEAGRANRDALQDLLTKSNELYLADIASGKSVEYATGKHQKRTEQVRKEAGEVRLNKEQTDKLIGTYGKIPPSKTTDLVLDGVKEVVRSLTKLYTLQRALAEGKTVNSMTGALSRTGTVLDFKAAGGPISGPGTGTSDDVPIMASHGEHMWTAREVEAAGGHGAMYAMRKAVMGSIGHYARGGAIAPVDESRRWPFEIDASKTHIMSRAQAASKVAVPFTDGGVGRGGTLPFILSAVRSQFPDMPLISGFRRNSRTLNGSRSLHADNRAGDFPPSRALAKWWNENYKARTREFISPFQEYNILRGQRHSYTGAVWRQHNFAGGNAHNHIAMDDGGFRMLQPGLNLIPNGTGRPEPIAGPAAMAAMGGGEVHIHIHDSVIASKGQAVDLLVTAYHTAKQQRRI